MKTSSKVQLTKFNKIKQVTNVQCLIQSFQKEKEKIKINDFQSILLQFIEKRNLFNQIQNIFKK